MSANRFDLQGHRGARGLRPENTIPAFDLAIRLGVVTLEMDVVISRDRRVVVSHDPDISSKICSHPDGSPVTPEQSSGLRLFDLTYDQIRAFDCGSRGHEDYPEQIAGPANKPLLEEVICFAEMRARELDRKPVCYNIETKSAPSGDGIFHPPPDEFADLLLEVVHRTGVSARTIIQSFDNRILQRVHSVRYTGRTALLVTLDSDVEFSAHVDALGFLPDIYSPDFRLVSESLVTRATEAGVGVLPWTVNRKEDILHQISLGVRGLITDYPDRAIAILIDRELW